MDPALVFLLIMFYIFGSFPTAFIVSYFYRGIDITRIESKNIGTLNTFRATRSIFLSFIVFITDFLKGYLPYLIISLIRPEYIIFSTTGLFGHNYPVFSKFKGGRGIAALLGLLFAINPILSIFWLMVWGVGYALTRYVFMGAIFANILLLIYGIFTGNKVIIIAILIVLSRYVEKVKAYLSGREAKGL